MQVDIYIHGVPNGQRTWGTDDHDPVITQFYGAGNEEQTKFVAEVRKSGKQNFCYYSILKYKNVLDEKNGRSGSYFGLTIRLDMVCTKTKAMFHILEMVYENAVVGKFIKKEGEVLKYIVSDFKDKEEHCKAIVDKIMTMMGQSLAGTDFIAITPSMLSGKGTVGVNLSEYSSESALAYINKNGSIAVSSQYPSTQLAAYIKKMEAEVKNLNQQSQQQISSIQQQAQQDLLEQKRKSDAAIQQAQQQAQQSIEQIKAKYADVDKKLSVYDQQLKQTQKDNKALQNDIVKLNKAVQDRDITIAKLRNSAGPYVDVSPRKPSAAKVFTSIVLPFVNLLIVIAVLVVLFLRMPSDNSERVNQISSDLAELKAKLMPQPEDSTEIDGLDGATVEIMAETATAGTDKPKEKQNKKNTSGENSNQKRQSLFEKAKAGDNSAQGKDGKATGDKAKTENNNSKDDKKAEGKKTENSKTDKK